MTTEAIDLRSRLPSARDQGARPTCLAFAVSDAHMVAGKRPGLLSPEYLHFHAARRANVVISAGVGLGSVRQALSLDGQPLEGECPYSDTRPESWVPPSQFSVIWTRNSKVISGKASEVLIEALITQRPRVLVFRVSRSFHMPKCASNTAWDEPDAGTSRERSPLR